MRASHSLHLSGTLYLSTQPTRACVHTRLTCGVGCVRCTYLGNQIQMKSQYGLTDSEIGLAYVPFGLATVLGTLLGGKVRCSRSRSPPRTSCLPPLFYCTIMESHSYGVHCTGSRCVLPRQGPGRSAHTFTLRSSVHHRSPHDVRVHKYAFAHHSKAPAHACNASFLPVCVQLSGPTGCPWHQSLWWASCSPSPALAFPPLPSSNGKLFAIKVQRRWYSSLIMPPLRRRLQATERGQCAGVHQLVFEPERLRGAQRRPGGHCTDVDTVGLLRLHAAHRRRMRAALRSTVLVAGRRESRRQGQASRPLCRDRLQ